MIQYSSDYRKSHAHALGQKVNHDSSFWSDQLSIELCLDNQAMWLRLGAQELECPR